MDSFKTYLKKKALLRELFPLKVDNDFSHFVTMKNSKKIDKSLRMNLYERLDLKNQLNFYEQKNTMCPRSLPLLGLVIPYTLVAALKSNSVIRQVN